jgi:hypothetical protein
VLSKGAEGCECFLLSARRIKGRGRGELVNWLKRNSENRAKETYFNCLCLGECLGVILSVRDFNQRGCGIG